MDHTYYLVGIVAIIGILLLIFFPKKLAVLVIIIVVFIGVHVKTRLDSEQRKKERLAVNVSVSFKTEKCGLDSPLEVMIRNNGQKKIAMVHWNIAAYVPGFGSEGVNVVVQPTPTSEWETPYSSVTVLSPEASHTVCVKVPRLAVQNYPGTLKYEATNKTVDFVP